MVKKSIKKCLMKIIFLRITHQIFNKGRKFYFGSYEEVTHAMGCKFLLSDGLISCQYLHFAQTEDIWLKSALEGRRVFR